MVSAESSTASMLMPARVEAMFSEEQTRSVVASASGMELMRRRSALAHALLHEGREAAHEVDAQRLSGAVHGVRDGGEVLVCAACRDLAIGVTETRLFAMGMPYSRSRSSATSRRGSRPGRDAVVDLVAHAVHVLVGAACKSEMPMVIVRRSRFCSVTMASVSDTSCGVMSIWAPLL
jgi:hypothetical protein